MNFIHIAGNLGTDPEVRYTSSGKKVTTLKVASRSRKGKNGEDLTIWWRVTVWGEQFDKMMSYLKKGSAVMVYGDVHKPEIFTDREGKPQASMEITAAHLEFSPFGKSSNTQGEGQAVSQPASSFGAKDPGQSGSYRSQGSEGTSGDSAVKFNSVEKIEGSSMRGETFDDEVPF